MEYSGERHVEHIRQMISTYNNSAGALAWRGVLGRRRGKITFSFLNTGKFTCRAVVLLYL
jgi:hypothetical protein